MKQCFLYFETVNIYTLIYQTRVVLSTPYRHFEFGH